jgi:hypothetical protein
MSNLDGSLWKDDREATGDEDEALAGYNHTQATWGCFKASDMSLAF